MEAARFKSGLDLKDLMWSIQSKIARLLVIYAIANLI